MRKKDIDNTLKAPVKEGGKAAEPKAKQPIPTDDAQPIAKTLENARKFTSKNMTGNGVSLDMIRYLAATHNNDLVRGFNDVFAIAYRYGYQQAKKDAKRKDANK